MKHDGLLDQIIEAKALQHPDSAKVHYEEKIADRDQKIADLEKSVKNYIDIIASDKEQ